MTQRRRAGVDRATCAVSTGAVEPDRATLESHTPDSRSQLVTFGFRAVCSKGEKGLAGEGEPRLLGCSSSAVN